MNLLGLLGMARKAETAVSDVEGVAKVATGAAGMLSGGWQLTAGIAVACLLAGAAGGGWVAWRIQAANVSAEQVAHLKDLQRISDAALDAQTAALAKQKALEQQVSELDATYSKELVDAREQADEARSAIAAGTRRLYVHASCPAGGDGMPGPAAAARMDNATPGRAVLDRSDSDALLRIAAGADKERTQLKALQAYVHVLQQQLSAKPHAQ